MHTDPATWHPPRPGPVPRPGMRILDAEAAEGGGYQGLLATSAGAHEAFVVAVSNGRVTVAACGERRTLPHSGQDHGWLAVEPLVVMALALITAT